ncbi:hypothetical protein PHMEG_00012333 [Phytophthora megakarya]|uniref:Eukaryotic/viral aspartic protease n=1 Tax=Phytophthora megakarya TaxID=4795 RepID=A0A225W915_9STRA|nr:hypothetical protein PHMEG_00012333 [Phytophthora megakarya]
MTPITEHSVSFDDSVDYSDAKEDDEDDYLEEKTPVSELSGGSVSRNAGVKALARNLAEELEEVAGPAVDSDDDGSDGASPSAATGKATSQSTGFRPPINGDTPGASKVIGKPLELMMTKSSWMQIQEKRAFDRRVRIQGIPYMHDSHVVTPRSASRQDGVVKENEASRPTTNTYKGPAPRLDRRYDLNEDSSDDGKDIFDVDNLEGDLTEEWARQISELSAMEEKNSTPRIEIKTHLPLGNIKAFSGYTNKSEKSMQWLLKFTGRTLALVPTITTQDPSHVETLGDAFIKYYCSKFNQSAKARYYSAKREDKEHVGLEVHFCHVWVKDIHDLVDMINDTLKRRDRNSKGESWARRSGGQDGERRRDNSRNEDSRSKYRRDDRRDESPYRPRITLAEALSDLVTALNETSVRPQTSQQASYDNEYELNKDSFGDGERRDDEDRYSNRGSEYDYAGVDERGHVAAANDHERRAAASLATTATDDSNMVPAQREEA